MKLSFDTNGNDKQKQAVRCWLNDDIFELIYGGAKGGGKSYLGVNLIFGDAFIYPGTHYFIARKRISDITKHTIPSIHEVFNSWGLDKKYYKYNGQSNIFTLHNDSKVYLMEAKYMPGDPLYERFGSMQMTRGWIEEGGEFNETAATNLKISIGRWKNKEYNLANKLLTTCNPKKNYLYRNVYKPSKNGTLPKDMAFIQALIQDNKTLPDAYVKNLFDTLKGSERQRLLFGNWEYDDDPNSLIESYDAIVDLFTNKVPDGKRYISCDAARFGSDKAVIIVFNGFRAIDKYTFDKSKTTDISDKIREFQIKYGVPNRQTIVDSDGVGGGVADEVNCVSFVNNETPKKVQGNKNYDNLKSQCAFMLADKVNDSELSIEFQCSQKEKEEIIEEFEQLKEEPSDGKKKLIKKDTIKDNIGRSPDWLDTFIMRMYFEVKQTGFAG